MRQNDGSSINDIEDLSIVHFPIYPLQQPIITECIASSDRLLDHVILPNGERYLTEPDESGPATLIEAIERIVNERGRVRKSTYDVLREVMSYGDRDARYWAEVLHNNDPRFEQFMPYYVQSSVIASLSLPVGVYIPRRPFYNRVAFNYDGNRFEYKSPNASNFWIVDEAELRSLLAITPRLVSIIIPAFYGLRAGRDNIDNNIDTYSIPDILLLRESSTSQGLIFPGGYAKGMYEFTAGREYAEEVSDWVTTSGIQTNRLKVNNVFFDGIVDQFISTKDGKVTRIKAHVYRFCLGTNENRFESIDPNRVIDLGGLAVNANDSERRWQIVPTALIYYHPGLTLSRITGEILTLNKKNLCPSPKSQY